MSLLSVLLDDFATAWTYSANWTARDGVATPFSDASGLQNRFVDQTYHSTAETNASVSLLFAGTALTVYGSSQSTSGYYTVQLDDEPTSAPISSYSDENIDNFVLWSSSNLSSGDHNLTLTNLGRLGNMTVGTGLLIDYARLSAVGGAQGATLTNTTIEDNDRTRLTYEGAWSSNEDSRFSGGTSTFTNATGSVSLKFNGSAIYVFGDTVSDHGLFTVSLDGMARQYQAKTQDLKFDTLKFFQGGLSGMEHTLVITNNPNAESTSARGFSTFFDLDSIVYTTPSSYADSSASTGPPSSSSTTGAATASASSGSGSPSASPRSTSAARPREGRPTFVLWLSLSLLSAIVLDWA